MLVLSRKREESILIGDDIRVMVIEIRGDRVRLGIEAPRSVNVHRQEVYEAIQRERRVEGGKVVDGQSDPTAERCPVANNPLIQVRSVSEISRAVSVLAAAAKLATEAGDKESLETVAPAHAALSWVLRFGDGDAGFGELLTSIENVLKKEGLRLVPLSELN